MVQAWYKETNKTWGDILDEAAKEYPNKLFIKNMNQSMTFLEFKNAVDEFSKGLLQVDVEKGENIAIWMGNRFEWLVAQFAIYKLGCVLVPVYTRWKKGEIQYALEQSNATTLIMEEKFFGKIDAKAMIQEIVPELCEKKDGDLLPLNCQRLKRVIMLGKGQLPMTISFNSILDFGKESALDQKFNKIADSVDPFDIMNIMYTSGTTGSPKGGMSMHRNNLATAYLWGKERLMLDCDDIILHNLPFYSNLGCFIVYLALVFRCSVVMTELFSPQETLELLEKEKISTIFGTPPMFAMLMDGTDYKKRDVVRLRKGVIGGANISPELFKKVVNDFGVTGLISGYGLSEAGAVSNSTRPNDSIIDRAETVGPALPNFRVKVVDPKSGFEMKKESEGEIWLHDVYTGSAIGKGYYNSHNKTAESFLEDGWFRTGDLGKIDERGYLRITGRLKDMALVGGFNVYPAEVERFLSTHPQVQQSIVLGVPDKRLGEVVMAYIVKKRGSAVKEEEIIEFCRENISNYKVPRYVRFIDVTDIPFSGHEKIQKYRLRERAIKELGLTEEF